MKLLQQGEKLKNVEKTARKPEQHSRDRKYLKKNYFIADFIPIIPNCFRKVKDNRAKFCIQSAISRQFLKILAACPRMHCENLFFYFHIDP
jgi:hypothetical protein